MDCLVVADDLTGAADAGHRFAARGHDAVVTSEDVHPEADVLVRDADSRDCEADEAARRVRVAIHEHEADTYYKKVDSTLRGNLVAEIDAALEATGADLGVVAPAFPANGRTTVGGYHLVDGSPVAGTGAGNDSGSPVETSSLPRLLAGSRHPVERLSIDVVSAGVEAIREELAGVGSPVLRACDAAREDHLEAIALAASRIEADVLYVGSAGLAGHVPFGGKNDVLGVVGSTTEEALSGLDHLPTEQVIELDGPLAMREAETAIEAASTRARERLASEGRAVVTAARSQADVTETLAAGEEAGRTASEVRDGIATSLGSVARRLNAAGAFDALYLTGGATASATLSELDATGIALTGRAVESGVPIGRIRRGVADDLPVVTRAGAFGDAETTLSCLDALAGYDG